MLVLFCSSCGTELSCGLGIYWVVLSVIIGELGIYWVVLSVLIDKDLYNSISTKIIFEKGCKVIIVHFLGIYSGLFDKALNSLCCSYFLENKL